MYATSSVKRTQNTHLFTQVHHKFEFLMLFSCMLFFGEETSRKEILPKQLKLQKSPNDKWPFRFRFALPELLCWQIWLVMVSILSQYYDVSSSYRKINCFKGFLLTFILFVNGVKNWKLEILLHKSSNDSSANFAR